jgi:hypothetical protein
MVGWAEVRLAKVRLAEVGLAEVGEQPRGTGDEQGERVEVALAVTKTPMQTGRGPAVVSFDRQGAEHGAGGHSRTGADGRCDRLVGRSQRPVGDAHHTATGEETRVDDHTCPGRANLLTLRSRQVDATMPGTPGVRGRVEPPFDLRRGCERPHPRG